MSIRSLRRALFARTSAEWEAFLEAAVCLGIAAVTIRIVPFRRISSRLGLPNRESPTELDARAARRLEHIAWALRTVPRVSPWKTTCLAQALAGRSMLHRRGISSTLYLGLSRGDTELPSLGAHAWLRSGSVLVTGGEGQKRFTRVASFADCIGAQEITS